MLKVLVADDERIAREIIVLLLNEQAGDKVIQQACDAQDVLQKVACDQPDILFLDIQMPGMTGIELAAQLPADIMVVFVTAYDEYAVQAFQLKAIDYLLKPFEDQQFVEVWQRAKQRLQSNNQSNHQSIRQAVAALQNQ
jgi:two-component system, LytTR family, response regulator